MVLKLSNHTQNPLQKCVSVLKGLIYDNDNLPRTFLTFPLFASLPDTCHFQKLSEECSNEFDFHWNSVPEAIGEYGGGWKGIKIAEKGAGIETRALEEVYGCWNRDKGFRKGIRVLKER